MRSGEVCRCAGILYPPGMRRKMSAFGRAGSPCRTAIWQPLGKIGGHGPHCSAGSFEAVASAFSPVSADAPESGSVIAVASMGTSQIRRRIINSLRICLMAWNEANKSNLRTQSKLCPAGQGVRIGSSRKTDHPAVATPLVGILPGPGGVIVFAAGLGLTLRTSMWRSAGTRGSRSNHQKQGAGPIGACAAAAPSAAPNARK